MMRKIKRIHEMALIIEMNVDIKLDVSTYVYLHDVLL